MNEAEIKIAQKILPRDWTSLREVVLKVIDFFGGPRGPGLAMVNRYLHAGLLELARVDPNGTMTEFSRMDREHRTIHAPQLDPAEGVRVEPYEAGQYFGRLAASISPATATPPADRPIAPAEESMPGPESETRSPTESPPDSTPTADVGDQAGAVTSGEAEAPPRAGARAHTLATRSYDRGNEDDLLPGRQPPEGRQHRSVD